jgi:hypothetical protein
MSRTTRISSTLAILLIVYWAYALLAVPWIEPPPPIIIVDQGKKTERPVNVHSQQLEQLKGLFPEDHWVWGEKTVIVESNRAKMLLQTYRMVEGGRMEIAPCIIVFAHEGPAESEEQRRRQSIILEAPNGALLQFDPPLDFNKPKATRLLKGWLKGDVTIRSDWKEPGPEDDLLITTRDIQITEQSISTPNVVEFRWGPHCGSGQDLEIKLINEKSKPGEATSTNITGIESFNLRHVELLQFDLNNPSISPGKKSDAGTAEIRCAGPFHFDVLRHVATFQDHVVVSQPTRLKTPDQLTCDVLAVHFADRPHEVAAGAKPENAKKSGSLDLIA